MLHTNDKKTLHDSSGLLLALETIKARFSNSTCGNWNWPKKKQLSNNIWTPSFVIIQNHSPFVAPHVHQQPTLVCHLPRSENFNLSPTLITISGSHVFSHSLRMGKDWFYYLGLDTRVFEALMSRSQKLLFQSLKVFLSLLSGEAPVAHNFFGRSQQNGFFTTQM